MLDSLLQLEKFDRSVGDMRLSISDERLRSLLSKCKRKPATGATAHAFSDWVYRLEHAPSNRPIRRDSFLNQARRRVSNVLDRLVDGRTGSWKLLSCDTGSYKDKIYRSSVLQTAKGPLRLKPDAVFRDGETGLVVIFEYKIPTPGIAVPKHGWPNLATQLWAYAWIDEWYDNPHVALVGATFEYDAKNVNLGEIWPRTIKCDPDLNRSCAALFRAWGGQISTHAIRHPSLRKLLAASSD